MADEQGFQQRMGRIEFLIQAMEKAVDPAVRTNARELVQAILDLHGTGLTKLLEVIAQAGETGHTILDALARDELAGSLLILHGLHPLDPETRVRQALDNVRPFVHSYQGDVELLVVEREAVRLRLQGSRDHFPTLKQAIEEAILSLAPDVSSIEIDVVETTGRTDGRLPLPLVGNRT